MKVKKKKNWLFITFIIFLFSLFICFPCSVAAEDNTNTDANTKSKEEILQEEYDRMLSVSGADSLPDKVDEKTSDILGKLGINKISPKLFMDVTPDTVTKTLKNEISDLIKDPLNTAAGIIGIMLFSIILKYFKDSFATSQLEETFNVVSILCICTAVVYPIVGVIRECISAVDGCTTFMAAYVPVFSSVLISSGQVASAGAYNTIVFVVSDILSLITSTILMPLTTMYFAISICGSLIPKLNLSTFSGFIQKATTWILGICTTLFVAIISIQGLIGTAGDSVSIRTTKFFVANLIPVIGGNITEMVTTVIGCFKLLKSSVGVFGIVVIAINFLPVLIKIILIQFVLQICVLFGDMFEVTSIITVLKAGINTLKICIAIIVCSSMFFIISTTIIMMMGMNMV